MSNKKIFILSLICLIIFFILPLSFAEDIDNQTIATVTDDDEALSGNNDIYFDSSLSNDNGDGSATNPYRDFKAARITDNCTIHLSEGEHNFKPVSTYNTTLKNVQIIGAGADKTILKGDLYSFEVNDCLTLTDLTLQNISIINTGTFKATNTVFKYCAGDKRDYSQNRTNTQGGAICTQAITDEYGNILNGNAEVFLDGCTFENNHAQYGGAIYMAAGSLIVSNSQFINNTAFNYGGAIACVDCGYVSISKSKFIKNRCIDDAGVIYIKSSVYFEAVNVDISNSSATFGSAITTLNCNAYLNNVNAYNNTAKYDGGAVYHMYGAFTSINSYFVNNSARNGGALFLDNSSGVKLYYNDFLDNDASVCAGAVYLMFSTLETDLAWNDFSNNKAKYYDDFYETWTLNMSIGNGNYDFFKLNETEITDVPDYYFLYDHGYLTEVKHQYDGGNCWAFTAMAVLESCIKKITGMEYDFSEENIKNLMTLYSDYGWDSDTNDGGHEDMAFGYLTSWLGPIDDSDDLYSPMSVLSTVFNSIVHVQNILFIKREDFTDNDAIKDAILRYGAVGTSMFYDDYYLNEETNSYYCFDYYGGTNHAVTIVGWDDNYSKDHFTQTFYQQTATGDWILVNITPQDDGAWIIRNSWGPNWGNNGYFYASYYDLTLGFSDDRNTLYTFVLNETETFDKNYQHEIIGVTGHSSYGNPTIWYKNVFTAEDFEILKAVSTYFSQLTNWTVTINVNNVPVTTKSGSSVAGYWTINLDDDVKLLPGDVFEVVFNITCDEKADVPTSGVPKANRFNNVTGISFISSNGRAWFDIGTREKPAVLCIKAFTQIDDYNTTTILDVAYNGYNPVNITATVLDVHGNFAKGKVTFNLNGEEIVLNLTDGKASLIHCFLEDTNDISCVFEGEGYLSSSNRTCISISKKEVVLNINVTREINKLYITVSASENINESIIFTMNNFNGKFDLTDGIFKGLADDLSNGYYHIKVDLVENYFWKAQEASYNILIKIMNTFIDSSDFTTTDFSNEGYPAYLYDENQNPLDGKTVIFRLNNVSYPVITENGKATLPINLSYGLYDIDIIFEGDNDFWPSNSSSKILVKTDVDAQIHVDKFWYDANVTVEFSKPITGDMILFVNNNHTSYSLNNQDKIVIPLSNLENGDYHVSVNLVDDWYNFTPASSDFNISVLRTHIRAGELTTTEFSGVNYTVMLCDERGNPLSGKTVIFRLYDGDHPVTTVEGKACLPVNWAYGEYEVDIIFEGDSDYLASANESSIVVKTDVSAQIHVDKFWYDANVTVVFSKPIFGDMVLFVNNENSTHRLIDKTEIVIPLTNLENGDYHVSVNLLDDWYDFTPVSYDFNISVLRTHISAGELTTTEFSGVNYTVKLTDENGNPLSGKNVTFKLNNVPHTVTTVEGKASIPVNLEYGKYDIEVIFEGDNEYFTSANSSSILVKTDVSAEIIISQSLRDANITVIFSKAITGDMILYVNNDHAPYRLNNQDGVRFSVNDLQNGHYDVSVVLLDDWYNFTGAKANFTISITKTEFVANNLNTTEFSGVSYEIKFHDENGNPLSKQIKVVLNGEVKFVDTDENGIASVTVSLKAGEYDIVISYSNSSDFYDNCEITRHIIVKANAPAPDPKPVQPATPTVTPQSAPTTSENNKVTSKITLKTSNKKVKKGKAFKYTAKLLENGKPLKGKKITFKIKGKTYKAKTNKKGIATVKIKKLKAGKYKIVAKYGKITSTSKITVK